MSFAGSKRTWMGAGKLIAAMPPPWQDGNATTQAVGSVPKENMPLQRLPALVPLSREHHFALLLARGVQKGVSEHIRATLPSHPRALAEHICKTYDEGLAGHFSDEEEVLMGAVRGQSVPLDAVCAEIVDEHTELRAMIAVLRTPTTPIEELEPLMDKFGKLLESHVRKEERSLYTGVQEALDEDGLRVLGEALEAARSRR